MSDRITIINNKDGTVDVNIDGENLSRVPTTNIDSTIHAVQWYGDHGEIEYDDRNEEITDFSQFNAVIADRDAEMDRIIQLELANEPSEAEKDRSERNAMLTSTDWIVIKYMDKNESMPQEWSDYRQSLRDITEQEGFPGNVNWPIEPETMP
jgi:hypothetical protein